MPLTPQQARLILDADAALLASKVKSGKSLSQSERVSLEALATEGDYEAKSLSELSKILQVSRQSIYNWQKQEGCPKTLMVQEWRSFIEAKESSGGSGTGRMAVNGNHFSAQDIADLRAQLLVEQHKRQKSERKLSEIELAKQEQGWIPKSEAHEAIRKVLEPLARILTNFPKRYASRVNPNNPQETESILRDCVNEVMRQIQAIER